MNCTEAKFPCGNDPDEPCPCPFASWSDGTKRKRRSVRMSNTFVQQVRVLSGDKRFPLTPVGEVSS